MKRYRILTLAVFLILLLGAALRLALLVQQRNLFMDEANVARNLYERDFAGLWRPLSYAQYAPPLFLTCAKASMAVFDAWEWALRLWPFLCSLACLPLLWLVLKRLGLRASSLYPLLLFATGAIYLRYATECKQYSSDVLAVLGLLLLALRTDIRSVPPARFIWIWLLAGSLAIWASMPSVFILAGVFWYYLLQPGRSPVRIVLPALSWAVQFGLYYFLLLKPSIAEGHCRISTTPVCSPGPRILIDGSTMPMRCSGGSCRWAAIRYCPSARTCS